MVLEFIFGTVLLDPGLISLSAIRVLRQEIREKEFRHVPERSNPQYESRDHRTLDEPPR